MKDKRQRIAIAWPYAAVYSDPAFAASILQAAANSVGMPYGYGPGAVPPNPLIAQQLPTNRLAYGFPPSVRYNPYPIPIPPQQPYPQPHAPSLPGDHLPPAQSPQDLSSQEIRSPTTSSTSSLSPDSERIKCDFGVEAGERTPLKSSPSSHKQQASSEKTTIPLIGDKPNLFRPYKSEV